MACVTAVRQYLLAYVTAVDSTYWRVLLQLDSTYDLICLYFTVSNTHCTFPCGYTG